MQSRPYFKCHIQELQQVFGASRLNLRQLRALQSELAHRRVPKARELKRAVDAAVVALGGEQAQQLVAGPRPRTTPPPAPAPRAGVGAAPPLDGYARQVAVAPAVVIVHKILPDAPSWTRSAWSIWLTHLAPGALATLGIILLFK